jgi:hypothetical protein
MVDPVSITLASVALGVGIVCLVLLLLKRKCKKKIEQNRRRGLSDPIQVKLSSILENGE